MLENYKIAVLLPVYKRDKPNYLSIAINSILGQTYSNVYLFIGVDGKVDHEIENCLQKYEKIERTNIIRFSENRGLAIVLNELITLCIKEKFEYIARMDADDKAISDRLEKQIFFLLKHPEIDVVGGAIEEIDENGIMRGKRIIYPLTSKDCRAFFAKRNPLAHPAVLFRVRFFEKAGCFYRPEYRQNQDTLLWFDGLKKGCLMANIPDVVLHFRMTNDLFKKRRNGYAFAIKSLQDRFMINKGLSYGFESYLFAMMMFVVTISPIWFKKLAYKLR